MWSALRDDLRRTLADPTLEVVYLRAGSGGWIGEMGEPIARPTTDDRAVTPIERNGKPFAALIHDPALLDDPERLDAAIAATSRAFDNEALKVELRAQLHDVQASRRRIVEDGDRARRRLERDLHDAAQQRLVGLALVLRMASRRSESDPEVTALLAEAAGELEAAMLELRELARGIHPAIVGDVGFGGALEVLAERPGVPVELAVELSGRLPDVVELGAYYVVAEALTNANKHAAATHVQVRASVVDDVLVVVVADDGAGGAAAVGGSGLEGLADRVEALGGRFAVESVVDRGTTVVAEIPVQRPLVAVRDSKRLAALRWMGWESWEVPAEAYDQLLDQDNLDHVRAVIASLGGPANVRPREREWLLGYHAAAGTAEWVLDLIATHDTDDVLEEVIELPHMTATRRGVLHDALRAASSDGPLTDIEVEHLRDATRRMGIPEAVFDELRGIVEQEEALRRRRYELIVAPMLPTPDQTIAPTSGPA